MKIYAVAMGLLDDEAFGVNRVDADYMTLVSEYSTDKYYIIDLLYKELMKVFSQATGSFSPSSVNLWLFFEDLEMLAAEKLQILKDSFGCTIERISDSPTASIIAVRLPENATPSICKDALDLCNDRLLFVHETELFVDKDIKNYPEGYPEFLEDVPATRLCGQSEQFFREIKTKQSYPRYWQEQLNGIMRMFSDYDKAESFIYQMLDERLGDLFKIVLEKHKGVLECITWKMSSDNGFNRPDFSNLFDVELNPLLKEKLKVFQLDSSKWTDDDYNIFEEWSDIHRAITRYSGLDDFPLSHDFKFSDDYDFGLALDMYVIQSVISMIPPNLTFEDVSQKIRIKFDLEKAYQMLPL